MEKVYEELEEAKAENEKLKVELRTKSEILNNLNKVQTEKLVEIREARLVIEKNSFEIEERTKELSELKRANEELQRCLKEKDSVVKIVNEANEKLRVNGEEKAREFEEERKKLVSALDEVSEKKIDVEQENNVYRAEIEGLKGMLAVAEKKKMEAEKTVKGLKETRGRDDVMVKIEEEKSKVEEKLKWKKEQFKHLEEAYEKLENVFKERKREWEEERKSLFNEIGSLQGKLESQVRIVEELRKKLELCTSVLTREETRRKCLEIEVTELKGRYEDAFAECRDVRLELEDLSGRRDEEIADLRQGLSMKDAEFKEVKYENRKLEMENKELLDSLKELQEATIQGSGNSALSKLKIRFQKLENIHKKCSVNLRSREAEWSSEMEKMAEEISDYKLQLETKERVLKEVELELENSRLASAKMRLEYEEVSIMLFVIGRAVSEAQSRLEDVKDEKREERSYTVLIEQVEQKNAAVVKAREEVEAERERVACLLKRIEMLEVVEEENVRMKKEVERYKETVEETSRYQAEMKEKMKEAEKDYEEKLLQVCDALDNTNSDLVVEREKVVELTRKVESFGVVEEKNMVMEKEMMKLEEMVKESEKCRMVLEEQITRIESESKENIRELCNKVDIAYAKLGEEVEKNASLVRKTESLDASLVRKTESLDQDIECKQRELENYKEMLEEAKQNQVLLQKKVVKVENESKERVTEVFKALETANSELSDKTSEVYQLEFQLWVWKSISKRLKDELEENQNLRKRVEASLIDQVGIGEAMRQERNELVHKLKSVSSESSKTAAISDSEKETLLKMVKNKDKMLREVQREYELLEQESLKRELEEALFAHITAENDRETLSLLLEQKQNEAEMVHKAWEKLAASHILTEVETEAKNLMIIELEGEISSLSETLETLEQSVSCFRQQMQEKLTTSEAEKTELVKEVSSLLSEKRDLLCLISEMESRMSKLCDEDTKLMRTLERFTQHCGKENNVESPRLMMKHEDVGTEDRSPFRQLNH